MRKQPQCSWHNSNYYLNVFVKPNEQCRACSYIVMARIGNRQHGALGEVERQNALFKERKEHLTPIVRWVGMAVVRCLAN